MFHETNSLLARFDIIPLNTLELFKLTRWVWELLHEVTPSFWVTTPNCDPYSKVCSHHNMPMICHGQHNKQNPSELAQGEFWEYMYKVTTPIRLFPHTCQLYPMLQIQLLCKQGSWTSHHTKVIHQLCSVSNSMWVGSKVIWGAYVYKVTSNSC